MTKARTNADNVAGDISGVTAGTGLTGGGTSGTVTLTNDMATTIAAAGDLIYGTGNDAYSALSIGTAGKVLKVNSGATAPEWAVDPTTDVVTTAGDLIYGTGADAVTRLGIGTAGQYLKVNSGATAPEWATLSAGGMTELATGTLSTVQVSITSISSAYNDLFLVINNPYVNTGSPSLAFRLNGRTDAVHQVTAMRSDSTTLVNYPGGGGSNANALPSADARQLGTATTDYVYCALKIERYASSNTRKVMQMTYSATDMAIQSVGYFYAVDAISSIQIRTSNGTSTFSGGTYTLWGIK